MAEQHKPKPPPRNNKPPPRPTGSNRHIRNVPTTPSQKKNLPSSYGRHRSSGVPKAVSTTDSVSSPDSHHSPPISINPKSNLKKIKTPSARSVPTGGKMTKSLPPSPLYKKKNSLSGTHNTGRYDNTGSSPSPNIADDEEKGYSRWASHPHASKMKSLPPGIDMDLGQVGNLGNNNMNNNMGNMNGMGVYSNNIMRPPGPPPVPNAAAKKRSGNIAGFDESTLNKIDFCNLEALMGTMHEGSECLKHFQKAMSTFATQQQKQCTTFLKLFSKSKSRYAQIESMPQFYSAVSLVHELLEETVRQSAEFAKFIEKSCLPMIEELDKQCTIKYQETYKMSKHDDKKFSDIKNEVLKARKATNNAGEKVIIAREKKSVHQQSKSRNNQLLQKDEASIQSTYALAKQKELAFKQRVMECEEIRRQYIDNRNTGKQDIIDMEHFRVGTMLSVVQKIINKQQSVYPSVNFKNKVFTLQEQIRSTTATMDAKSIILKFVDTNLETFGQWREPEPVRPKLEVEYRDMFYSIDDAMEITLDMNPQARMPMLVPVLCEKIKDLDGFRTEGIFRKSPNKMKMLRIKEGFRKKNFQLTDDDPHVYAALLKDWLRGLQDFLIPKRYYPYCCDMAREGKLNGAQFEVFFSQMPQVNRSTLKYLILFLRELLEMENQQYTKMNLENIAIVFGPTLLMSDQELTPQVAMTNAKYEKQFVMSLITDSQGSVTPM